MAQDPDSDPNAYQGDKHGQHNEHGAQHQVSADLKHKAKDATKLAGYHRGLHLPFTATGILRARCGDKIKYDCVGSIIHTHGRHVFVLTSGHCCYDEDVRDDSTHKSIDAAIVQRVHNYKGIVRAKFNSRLNRKNPSPVDDAATTMQAFGGAYYTDYKTAVDGGAGNECNHDWCVIRFDDGPVTPAGVSTLPHLKIQYVTHPPKSTVPLFLSTYWTPRMNPAGLNYLKRYVRGIKGQIGGNHDLIRIGQEFTAGGMSGSPFVFADDAKDKIRGILMGRAENCHDQITRITMDKYNKILAHINAEIEGLMNGAAPAAIAAARLTGVHDIHQGVTNAKSVHYDQSLHDFDDQSAESQFTHIGDHSHGHNYDHNEHGEMELVTNKYYNQYGEHEHDHPDNVYLFAMGVIMTIGICCFVMIISIMINFCACVASKYYKMRDYRQSKHGGDRYNIIEHDVDGDQV